MAITVSHGGSLNGTQRSVRSVAVLPVGRDWSGTGKRFRLQIKVFCKKFNVCRVYMTLPHPGCKPVITNDEGGWPLTMNQPWKRQTATKSGQKLQQLWGRNTTQSSHFPHPSSNSWVACCRKSFPLKQTSCYHGDDKRLWTRALGPIFKLLGGGCRQVLWMHMAVHVSGVMFESMRSLWWIHLT